MNKFDILHHLFLKTQNYKSQIDEKKPITKNDILLKEAKEIFIDFDTHKKFYCVQFSNLAQFARKKVSMAINNKTETNMSNKLNALVLTKIIFSELNEK